MSPPADALSRPPRLALVTGGEGALGGAIASELRHRGFEVLAPGRGELDVASAESVDRYFSGRGEALAERLELLVNNAGIRRDRVVVKMREADWDEVLRVNLRGTFLCSRAAMRHFVRRRSGHIVNVGSYSGAAGPAGQGNYAAAKAGLVALTRSLAKEGGRRGVRANCILPGWMETRFTEGVAAAAREAALESHSLGRLNTPPEAARFIAFLHLEMGAVSGQVMQLDSRI